MNKMAQDALNQKSDLKLIMKGEVIKKNNENFGVTSIILNNSQLSVDNYFTDYFRSFEYFVVLTGSNKVGSGRFWQVRPKKGYTAPLVLHYLKKDV